MRITITALLIATLGLGCADAPPTVVELEHGGGDGSELALEGAALSELDSGRVYQAHDLFERIGLMWDAPAEGAIEVRGSADGKTWSAWQKPAVMWQESGSFSGHVDIPGGAEHFQLRVPEGAEAPTWLKLDTIGEIPPPHAGGDAVDEQGEQVGEAEQALGFKIQSRKSWGARKPKCASGTNPVRATIHHTVTPTSDPYSPPKRLRQIQAFHMYTRGYCDIAYNYLVSRDGRVWMGRGKNQLGAHVANYNTGNVGISFIGDYTNAYANKKQRCGASRLLRWLHQKHPAITLDRKDVKGHRQFGSTACPGNKLYQQLDSIVKLAKKKSCG